MSRLTAGRVGEALLFDGVNDQLRVEARAELETTSAFTVTAWIRQDQIPFADDYGCPFSKLFGTLLDNSWQICVRQIGEALLYYTSMGTTDLNTIGAVALGDWTHVAITWDGSAKALWIDGSTVASSPSGQNIQFDGGSVLVGSDIDEGDTIGEWPGAVDDLRIYNRVLSAPEVDDLANP